MLGAIFDVKDNVDCSQTSGWVTDGLNIHGFTYDAVNSWAVCTYQRPYNFTGATDPFKIG